MRRPRPRWPRNHEGRGRRQRVFQARAARIGHPSRAFTHDNVGAWGDCEAGGIAKCSATSRRGARPSRWLTGLSDRRAGEPHERPFQ
jgi:hypothetical protein